MLLDRATALSEKIKEYQKLKAAANQASVYRTRAIQFGAARTSLSETLAALYRFDDAAIPVDFKATNADILLENAKTLSDSFKAGPDALNLPPFNLKYEFFDRISNLSNFGRESLSQAWRSYVYAHSVNSSPGVLDALMKISQFRASVITIKACLERIDRLASQTPSDPGGALKMLETLVQEYRSAWLTISADGIPDSVLKFLRNSSLEGSPLSEFTEEIHKWLDSKGLLGAFRIRIG